MLLLLVLGRVTAITTCIRHHLWLGQWSMTYDSFLEETKTRLPMQVCLIICYPKLLLFSKRDFTLKHTYILCFKIKIPYTSQAHMYLFWFLASPLFFVTESSADFTRSGFPLRVDSEGCWRPIGRKKSRPGGYMGVEPKIGLFYPQK